MIKTNNETEKQTKDLEKFLKEAFCIDGKCEVKSFDKVISKDGRILEGLTFLLEDSKRGEFYITMCRK